MINFCLNHKTAPPALALFVAAIMGSALCPPPALAATETILHQFSAFPHGESPVGLIADSAGNFYGVAQGGTDSAGVVYRLVADSGGKLTQTILYNFTGGLDGGNPAGVVWDRGSLYGFASGGGSHGAGTFFQLTPSPAGAWKATILYNFSVLRSNPLPSGPFTDSKGHFLAVSYDSPTPNGSIFELSRTNAGTWNKSVIYTFSGGADGSDPDPQLTFDSSGNLYGTTVLGGASNGGVVFELSPSASGSWNESLLHNFSGGQDGDYPQTGVIFDSAGSLYGLTGAGGGTAGCNQPSGCGTAFQLTRASNGFWTETVLYRFTETTPLTNLGPSPLAIDSQGNLFATTYQGGTNTQCYAGCGTLFELSPSGTSAWTETVLSNFANAPGGYNPSGTMVFSSGGRLYGTTSLGGLAGELNGTVFEATPASGGGWTTRTAYGFPTTDGDDSRGSLIEDAAGNLYGTTAEGGPNNVGAVFELSPISGGGWKEKILYTFTETLDGGSPFGAYPSAGLVMDSAGNLYGTTSGGGDGGLGTVFRLSPNSGGQWSETVLHSFTGGDADGQSPFSGLALDPAGNLYGTTEFGGANGLGVVFELSQGAHGEWIASVIHQFAGFPSDGSWPLAGLVLDAKGNLYGATFTGGNSTACPRARGLTTGCGTVFELLPGVGGVWNETVLYSFTNSNGDGSHPEATLVFDEAGNLYGTTTGGGLTGHCFVNGPDSCGTVFELAPNGSGGWKESVLYAFRGSPNDGSNPGAGLVRDATGNLYGTTVVGGNASNGVDTYGLGTVFELSPEAGGGWTETVLHNFQLTGDGRLPQAGLLLDGSGRIYGTTTGDASLVGSVVFELAP